jgi:hypothetical protein
MAGRHLAQDLRLAPGTEKRAIAARLALPLAQCLDDLGPRHQQIMDLRINLVDGSAQVLKACVGLKFRLRHGNGLALGVFLVGT